MAEPRLPYGDGRAGYRIAALIEQWLAGRAAGFSARQGSSSGAVRSI